MPPIVIDLHSVNTQGANTHGANLQGAEYSRDVVHQIVQTLAEGKLVLFPTETVYGIGASACSEEGMQRLIQAKGRNKSTFTRKGKGVREGKGGKDGQKPFTLAVKSAEEALDYVPRMGAMGERLARRCWPGPITLVLDHTPGEGLVSQLPPSVQKAVLAWESHSADRTRVSSKTRTAGKTPATTPSNFDQALAAHGQKTGAHDQQMGKTLQTLGLRVPAHTIVLDVLRMLTGPIALSSANRSGESAAATATAALQNLETEVAMALDDGRCHYGQPSTVVRVSQHEYTCLREGVVGDSALDRLSSMIILFVCTGNTCRSPMAEAMMRRQIAGQLGINDDALERPDHKTGRPGVIVTSAGIAALPGCSPSSEAVEVMREKGIPLDNHESQPLTDKLVQHADLIYTMTVAHRQALLRRWPDAALRTHVVRKDAGNISDPIGGTAEIYRQCRSQIEHAVQQRMKDLDL